MLNGIHLFRKTALLEGISLIILIFIAVPLKHFSDFPWRDLPVKYIGWLHGLLFISYVYLLVFCWQKYGWKVGRTLLFFFAALVPFAPFFVEKKLKPEDGV